MAALRQPERQPALPQRDGPGQWSAAAEGSQRRAAAAAALDVGTRIADPVLVRSAVQAAAAQTSFPRTAHWAPNDVAQGDAGLALLCAQLDVCFPEAGWDLRGHELLTSAARAAEGTRPLPSIFSGLSGIGFAAHLLSRDGTRYQRLAGAIDDALLPQALELARSADGQRRGVSAGLFDVISGLAGVGAYLLTARGRDAVRSCLETVLEALAALVSARDGAVPAWFTPAELLGDAKLVSAYPRGALNCGLAHGIPGPLALMALAQREGVDVPGLHEATEAAAAWLVAHRRDDEWGVNWPTMVGWPGQTAGPDRPSRSAWCYGSPGVARALWLAGRALGDETLMALAITAMEAVYRRPLTARNIDSPTFCHGVAGLLQVTLRFANDTGLPVFRLAATDLVAQLLAAYDPGSLLGFRAIEPGGAPVDQPGLLDGAPGVALALLAAVTDVPPAWDRLFLLA